MSDPNQRGKKRDQNDSDEVVTALDDPIQPGGGDDEGDEGGGGLGSGSGKNDPPAPKPDGGGMSTGGGRIAGNPHD